MDKRLEPLFTPWKIGNCEIKNRVVLTSMGGTNLFGWMERHHFDEMISSAGYIATPLAPADKTVHLVGDCREIGSLRSVVWGAYETAMTI